ncbi:hypothetical protein EBQ90_03080 [bacterium]|nr:hypothetical protein [bacterium]
MKPHRDWVDHPEAQLKSARRTRLRLVISPPEAPPETPAEKAVSSISPATEVALVLFAQGVLIGGLFLAANLF